jgi:apolipoprotein N-acyltransferase
MLIILLSILAGAIIVLAFNDIAPTFLTVLGLGIFFFSQRYAATTKTALVGAFIFGVMKAFGGLMWLIDVDLVSRGYVETALGQYIYLFVYLLFCSFLVGVPVMLVGLVLRSLQKHLFLQSMIFPVIIVTTELLGSALSALVAHGGESMRLSFFGFSYLSYAISPTSIFVVNAVYGGVFTVSFIVAAVGAALGLIMVRSVSSRSSSVVYWAGALLCLLVMCVTVAAYQQVKGLPESPKGMVVAAVSTKVTAGEKREIAEQNLLLQEILEQVSQSPQRVDYVIFPEDARFIGRLKDSDARQLVRAESVGGIPILIDSARVGNSPAYLRASVVNSRRNMIHYFDKQHLVPQGEYLSAAVALMLALFFDEHPIKKDLTYVPGPKNKYTDDMRGLPMILFCFESFLPFSVQSFYARNQEAAHWVAHPVSHGWFTRNSRLSKQTETMLLYHSIWNNKPIVQAGNMTESKLYLPNGLIESGTVIFSNEAYTITTFSF